MSLRSKLLIDGDIVVYRAGFSAETKKRDSLTAAIIHTQYMIKSIMANAFSNDVTIYLTASGKSNYRYQRATLQPYKGNREDKPKPRYYAKIRDYLVDSYDTKVIQDREADDALGCDQTEQTVICTIDKDLDMIPGWHYNPVKQRYYELQDDQPLELHTRATKDGNRHTLSGGGYPWFYAQMLLGDRCDNVPGVKGYGAVKVYKLLKECYNEQDLVEKVFEAYLTAYGAKAKENFLEIADLLWIQREVNQLKSKDLEKYL